MMADITKDDDHENRRYPLVGECERFVAMLIAKIWRLCLCSYPSALRRLANGSEIGTIWTMPLVLIVRQ